jgi:argininosuccinate lyase
MGKLWQKAGGGEGLHPDVESFLSSLSVDSRLLREDIECSIAHAEMLGAKGILPSSDAAALSATLRAMLEEAGSGALVVDPGSEDVHSFIESELTKRLGDIGKAVHAGRSRNDQVAVAFRLHAKRAFANTKRLLLEAIQSVLDKATPHTATIMPGYTHLQRAQPVTLAHHLLAWCAALERDCDRLESGLERADESPLGSAALAGSGLPIDRGMTSSALGFARPSRNTMDAVSDRDFCVDYASACASIMSHLSRACEDIALWTSTEYGFVRISDAASTGSSIMPQKRNPDPAELIRGKSARVLGDLQALLVLQKGLPYAYDRDLQEDKSLFFDVEDTMSGVLKAFAILVHAIEPNVERMRNAVLDGYLEATDVAELLVKKGQPFRIAYQASKSLVQACVEKGVRFSGFSGDDILAVHPAFGEIELTQEEFRAYIDPWACVERRNQTGGPAQERTTEEIARLSSFVSAGLGS